MRFAYRHRRGGGAARLSDLGDDLPVEGPTLPEAGLIQVTDTKGQTHLVSKDNPEAEAQKRGFQIAEPSLLGVPLKQWGFAGIILGVAWLASSGRR